MSVFGSRGTAEPAAEAMVAEAGAAAVEVEEDEEEPGTSLMDVEQPRKRKGETEQRDGFNIEGEEEDDDDLGRCDSDEHQVKLKCSREPHSLTEKRRREKMNGLIDELSTMIPSCHGRKMNKTTVLRKAVQHLKSLKGSGTSYPDVTSMSSILSQEELRELLLKVADGFLLVVSCDRAKILFISESVSKVLNHSHLELTGKSLFDYVHYKDINKVKEQLATADLYPRNHVAESDSEGVKTQVTRPKASYLFNTGARRVFFCRMKNGQDTAAHKDQSQPPNYSKNQDSHKYSTFHCTGYMHTWAKKQLQEESDTERPQTPDLTCLVMVCRPLPHSPHKPPKEVTVKPAEFVTRCAIDGKFTFVDQRAMAVIGYLPQEILGISCYEYFHQGDLRRLAEKHRQVLRSKEKIETPRYRFKTKHGSYVVLESQWSSFRNPWTKEVEFIVSLNRLVSRPSQSSQEVADSSKELGEVLSPVITGLCDDVGTMIYAGSIGTQIANEHIESLSSQSTEPSSSNLTAQDKVLTTSVYGSSGVTAAHTSVTAVHTCATAVHTCATAVHTNMSEMEEIPGCSFKSHPDLDAVAGLSGAASESRDEPSPLDLDSLVPDLSSYVTAATEESNFAVILRMLESDANMAQSDVNLGQNMMDPHWSP